MRILIVEDEPRMLQLLSTGLYEHGFTVMTAADGQTGLAMATVHELDAILLDIGLPRLNGFSLMEQLRGHAGAPPVMMLTACDAEDDMIRGLDLGADDYLTKPFSFPELVARLQSITRRQHRQESASIQVGNVAIDLLRHAVVRESQGIDLTRMEFNLLVCLARRAGQTVPRQALMESVWGRNHLVGSGALDVLVNSLRAKFDAPYREKLIGTVRGTGYLLRRPASAQARRVQ